jgi:hypothetical protein
LRHDDIDRALGEAEAHPVRTKDVVIAALEGRDA